MQNVNRSFNGGLTFYASTALGSNTSHTTVPGGYEIVEASGIVQGDRKHPNYHRFKVLRANSLEYKMLRQGYLYGQPAVETVTGNSYHDGNSLDTALAPDYAATTDKAMAKIYDQLRGNSNLAVDLAESGMTLKMIRNALSVKKQFKEFLANVVRGKAYRKSKGQARLDYVTQKWLEGRYGWLPFVHSTYDALENLARRVDGGLFVVGARASGQYSETFSGGPGDGSFGAPKITIVADLSFRTEICAQFNLPPRHQIHDWTSLNPLGIAWELTPLSFVADWFLNVGQTLSLWENYCIYANQFVGGYQTNSCKEERTRVEIGESYGQPTYWPNGQPMDGFHIQTYSNTNKSKRLQSERHILLSLPSPAAGIRVNVNLSSTRLLDAAALFHQLVGARTRSF